MRCNVYGVIVAPEGLGVVLRAVECIAESAGIDPSSEKYGDALWFLSDAFDLRTLPCQYNDEHNLSGFVGGSLTEVGIVVRKLSETLQRAHIKHFLDIYD